MDIKNTIFDNLTLMGEKCTGMIIKSIVKVQDALFVVSDLKFDVDEGANEYTIPFIIYNDGGVFMPNDWQGWTPNKVKDIDRIDWVSMPEKNRAIMLNGLPRMIA